jgi:hypothetical protein
MFGPDSKNKRVFTFTVVKKPDRVLGLGFAQIRASGTKQVRNAVFQNTPNMFVFTELADRSLTGDVTMQWVIHKNPRRKDGMYLATCTAHWNGLGGIRTYSMSGWAKKK